MAVKAPLRKQFWWLGLLLCVAAGQAEAQWLSDKQSIMGTEVSVALWVEDPAKGREAIAAVMQDMRAVDSQFSPYISTSELAQINKQAAQKLCLYPPKWRF